jgi:hypothetical protein
MVVSTLRDYVYLKTFCSVGDAGLGLGVSGNLFGDTAKSGLTPEQMAFYATPADPLVPDDLPIFDSTPEPVIQSMFRQLVELFYN